MYNCCHPLLYYPQAASKWKRFEVVVNTVTKKHKQSALSILKHRCFQACEDKLDSFYADTLSTVLIFGMQCTQQVLFQNSPPLRTLLPHKSLTLNYDAPHFFYVHFLLPIKLSRMPTELKQFYENICDCTW